MHSISFQLKRAHWRAVMFGQRALARVPGMTPARFDVLYALRQVAFGFERHAREVQGTAMCSVMKQSELWRTLGVSRSTLSRMLKQLAMMGWIAREPYDGDRRTKLVMLTPEGLRRIWRAMRRVFRGRTLMRPYEELFSAIDSKHHVLVAIDEAWCTIDAMARRFGDTSTLLYEFGRVADD